MRDAAAMSAAVLAGWILATARADAGLLALVLLLASAALGFAHPRRAAVLGVAAAAPVAAVGIVYDASAASLAALAPAIVGAYAGALGRVALVRGRAA